MRSNLAGFEGKLRSCGLSAADADEMARRIGDMAERVKNNGRPPICRGDLGQASILMRVFEHEKSVALDQQSRGTVMYDTVQAAVVHTTIPALETLSKIGLREVADSVNKIHWDRVLYATVIAEPFKTVAVHIMIYDLSDRVCRLSLYNYGDDYKKLKCSTRIAVLAPYMKHSRDCPKTGMVMLRCDHPEGVIVFASEGEWREAMRLQGSGQSLGSLGNFQQLKERGNKAFQSRNFPLAIASYTTALNLAENDADRVTTLSNRSQCYLNISAYTEALADAESALAIDSSHAKSAARQATAWFWLRRPQEVLAPCANVLAQKPENVKIFRPLEADARRAMKEIKGEYDCRAILDSVQPDGTVKVCHLDYAHPSIRVVPSATKGRMMVATTDIEAGTLIMFSKAFGVEAEVKQKPHFNLGLYASDCDLRFATSLSTKLRGMLPRDRRLFFALSSGGGNAALSVDFLNAEMAKLNETFQPGAVVEGDGVADEYRGEELALEGLQERLIKIIHSNAFKTGNSEVTHSELSQKLQSIAWKRSFGQQNRQPTMADLKAFQKQMDERDKGNNFSAIFILPSLFNHSCCANVTWMTMGDMMVVRTTRRVEKDAELTVSYLDMKRPYYDRKKVLQNWVSQDDGFACDCERCVPIAAIGETPAQRRARADTELFLHDAYQKISSLTACGTLSKESAIKQVIPAAKLSAIKREMAALPVQNQDGMSILLDLEIGTYSQAGDAHRALQVCDLTPSYTISPLPPPPLLTPLFYTPSNRNQCILCSQQGNCWPSST